MEPVAAIIPENSGLRPLGSASLDVTLDMILHNYCRTGHLDGATEILRQALHARLREAEVKDSDARLLEVNLIGSLASWIEFCIEERENGQNRVPDFARSLRHIFISHCRKHEVEPKVAVEMAIELATAIIDLALAFQRHLGIEAQENAD
jgi:hypothetical protein